MIISTYKISARTNVTSIFITDNMIDENPQNKQNTEHHVFSVTTIFLISSGMGASRVILSPVTGWTKLLGAMQELMSELHFVRTVHTVADKRHTY